MSRSPHSKIDNLERSLRQWVTIEEFDRIVVAYFNSERSVKDVADYRTKSGAMKKLRDEITPVHRYTQFFNKRGEIRFALNDNIPDVWFRTESLAIPQGMEVTVALAREQHYLGKELNEKQFGRGFIGLQDDASGKEFDKQLAKGRTVYATKQVLDVVATGIQRCLAKKSNKKYEGFDLLVEAPLGLISKEHWVKIQWSLARAAAKSPFREVYVIGNRDGGLFGFKLK